MKQNLFKITDDGKLKTSEIIAEMKEKFDVYCWYSNQQLDKDFPPPKKATTRYFKKTVEADEEHRNKSANDLEKEGVKGCTLRERLFMELEYFEETGGHLDIDNITLCSGSRSSGGGVPGVGWDADSRRVCVGWSDPVYRDSGLRTRAAVSENLELDTLPLDSALKLVKEAGYVIYKPV